MCEQLFGFILSPRVVQKVHPKLPLSRVIPIIKYRASESADSMRVQKRLTHSSFQFGFHVILFNLKLRNSVATGVKYWDISGFRGPT